MRRSSKSRWLTFAVAALLAPFVATAQQQSAGGAGPASTRIASLPDWAGVWAPDWKGLFGGPPKMQLTPAAAAALAKFTAARERGENLQGDIANCVPPGMPGIMRMPYPIEFVFTPKAVYLITETFSQVRRIYTDGRPLPEDPDPFFNGHSVGRWEGDALVVDTIGLNPSRELQPGIKATEQTRLRETFRLSAPDRITVETTIIDPTIFTQPLVVRQDYVRKPDWEMREYICQENNRDSADEFGRPRLDID
jgi:hypothetical protein